MDLIKQKLKLLGHTCRMDDQRLVKTVMLRTVEKRSASWKTAKMV